MADRNVNEFYQYSINILGNFSGGTAASGQTAPHPVAFANGDSINDLSAIALGGFAGLNN
jgi:hypothetical protein